MSADTSPGEAAERARLGPRRRLVISVAVAIGVGLGIHVAYPALAGLDRSVELLGRAELWWIAAAFGFSALSLGCYVAVFRYVVGGDSAGVRLSWGEAYQVAMASQAASTVVTAAGAGGIAVLFWALSRAGFDRAAAAARVVAFLAFHYGIYLGALVVFGSLLWLGVLPGPAPTALTLVPAAFAAVAIAAVALAASSPARFERWLFTLASGDSRRARLGRRLVTVPVALASGVGYAVTLLRPRARGATLVALSLAYWAANIAILAACFEAFGETPAFPRLVQAFFIGMTVNLLPLLPGGVGSVEAGLIAALLAFGEPAAEVVVSVLAYRLIGFWLPTIPEAFAYLRLRRTVERWRAAASMSRPSAR
jgi:uncharacterized protein (TIRG00374 family)